MSALGAVSSSIATQTAQTVALANSLQQSQAVVGLLEAGQQNLEALASKIEAPTLDGTGARV
ncbi:MAG: hypothetical protein ABJN04_05865, partial [Hyphomicrobiales bacterium]